MPDEPPNILLITTDQQRFDTIGEEAPGFLRTPHTDLLQRQGITFTRAYSGWPVCTPARASIMDGKTQIERGIGHNEANEEIDRATSLPTRLREQGYQTAAFGKMHFASQEVSPRIRHGFDEMVIGHDYYREKLGEGRGARQPMRHGIGQNEMYPARSTVHETETLTAWIVEQVVDYVRIRNDPTLPFFCWCSFSKPHPPWDPPEPYYSMYQDSPIPEPVESRWGEDPFDTDDVSKPDDPETLQAARAAYYGLITHIDYTMGRIFGALEEGGLLENTLILFTSDHGEFLGDHGKWGKGAFHDVSARVPFVLRLPLSWENRRAETTNTTPVQLADIMPTFLSAAGRDPSEVSTGQDLIGLARGRLDDPRNYAVGASPDWAAITDGEWKYIWSARDGSVQMFDLQTDPNELSNVADKEDVAGKRAELRGALIEELESHDSGFVENGELTPTHQPSSSGESSGTPAIRTEYFRERDVLH